MKRLLFKLGVLVVILGLILPMAASAAADVDSPISGGNTIIARPEVDGIYGINMVDMTNPVSSDGVITNWQIWAYFPNPVKLKIYRATANPDVFTVVGQSVIETPTVGANSFTLATPILVKAGDYVGFRTPMTYLPWGTIAFEYGVGSVRYGICPAPNDTANGLTDNLYGPDRWNDWPLRCKRTYSLYVSGSTISLNASPLSDVNPANTSHTITANIGTAVAGVPVFFNIISGPNNGTSGIVNTNSSGVAEFTYLSHILGVDTIRVWIDQDSSGTFNADDPSVIVTKTWVIPATIDINPNTLNLKSQSDKNAITAYIEFPAGYDVWQINVATVKMDVNGTMVPAQLTPTSVGDYDQDRVPDRMVKFDRQAVITALANKTGDVILTMSGQFGGNWFTATDTIKVVNQGK